MKAPVYSVLIAAVGLAAFGSETSTPPFVRSILRVDVPSGDVRDVLRAIADAAGLSVLVPGELSGNVSLRLDGIPYADAFEAILKPRGYGFRVLPSGFVVIQREPRPGTLVHLRHRRAEEVKVELSKLIRQGESVEVLGDGLVVDADLERTARLVEWARTMDRPLRQVLVECRFQEVSSRFSRTLGIKWASLGAYGLTVEPKVADLGTGQALGAVLDASQFSIVLSALDTAAGTRVLSRPVLLASEGRESSVAVGQQYPLPQYSFSQEQSVLQVSGFQFKDIGVLLKVTPHFSGNRVSLDLDPEVSSVVSTTTYAGAGAATLPIIATRRVKTHVELRDGETMAISGLISTDATEDKARVRGASSIPVLGAFFRSRSRGNSSTELIVFVTVRFVESAADVVIPHSPEWPKTEADDL